MKYFKITASIAFLLSASVAFSIAATSPNIIFRYNINGASSALSDISFSPPETFYKNETFDGVQASLKNNGSGTTKWAMNGVLPSGLTFSTNGKLSGTPLVSGKSGSLVITATDQMGQSVSSAPFVLSIRDLPVLSDIVSRVTINQSQTIPLPSTGGVAPFTASVISGSLPSGYQLSGISVTGVSSTAQSGSGKIRITDVNGRSSEANFSIDITDQLIAAANFIDGYVGVPYLPKDGTPLGFSGKGGSGAYSWSLTGTLPSGLSFNPLSGVVSGVPGELGDFNVSATLYDPPESKPAVGSFTIFGIPSLSAKNYPDPYVGEVFSDGAAPALMGGKGPINWASSGLPTGLTIDPSTGNITGTLAQSASIDQAMNLEIAATDANGISATLPYSFTPRAPVEIVDSTPHNAIPNQAYEYAFSAKGGKPDYVWSTNSADIPVGLTLNQQSGLLSGTPSASGNYSFTVEVADANSRKALKSVTMSTVTELLISSLEPKDAYTNNKYADFSYSHEGGIAPYSWSISNGILPEGLSLNQNGLVSGTPIKSGFYDYTVTLTDGDQRTADQTNKITVYDVPSIQVSNIDDAYVGHAIPTHQLNLLGGKPSYVWNISEGALPSGIVLNPDGSLSGTPSKTEQSTFTVKVSDLNGVSGKLALIMDVYSVPSIADSGALEGFVGIPYSVSFVAAEGRPALAWSLDKGALPSGVTLSASGLLSGTPTSEGAFSFTVKVADANGMSDSQDVSVHIVGSVAIAQSTLSDAYVGTAITPHTFTASSGKAGYTWSADNKLPQGLSLSSTGILTGTPLSDGTHNFNVTVTDGNGLMATQSVDLTVWGTFSIASSVISDGYASVPVTAHTFTSVGGKPGTVWTVSSGSLPSGMTLSSAGILTGTPTASGKFSFTLDVADGNGVTAQEAMALDVYALPAMAAVNSEDGYVGHPYSVLFASTGGKATTSLSVMSGAVPTGLSFDTSTGELSGTPTAAGAYNFSIQVTDANGRSSNASFDISIVGAVEIAISNMSDGYVGESITPHTFTASGGKAGYSWSAAGNLPAGLLISSNGVISGTPSVSGSYSFDVIVTDGNNLSANISVTMSIWDSMLIASTQISDGYVGTSILTQSLSFSGGKPSVTWSVVTGALPTGVSLSSDGTLSGTPQVAGLYNFELLISDGNGRQASRAFAMNVYNPIAISGLPATEVYVHNSFPVVSLTTNGGKEPFVYSIVSGALPSGMSLSPSGELSGVVTTSGIFNYVIASTDANSVTGSASYNLTVYDTPAIYASNVGDRFDYVAFAPHAFQVSGGKAPFTWTETTGVFSSYGLALSSDGVLTGSSVTANRNGIPFVLVATDVNGIASPAISENLYIYSQLLLAINGIEGTYVAGSPVTGTLSAQDSGKAPYTYSVASGAMPDGLSLNATTGEISGISVAVGNYSPVFQVQDGHGNTASISQSFEIKESTVMASMTSGASLVSLQSYFAPEIWSDTNIKKVVNLPSDVIRGNTNPAIAAVNIGDNPWAGDLAFLVDGEVQGASGPANSGVGGSAFDANIISSTGDKINLIVAGAIRAGGGGGGHGGTGGNGFLNVEVREPATGDHYDVNTWHWFSLGSNVTIRWNSTVVFNVNGSPAGTSKTVGEWTYYKGAADPAMYNTKFRVWRTKTDVIEQNGGVGGNGALGQGYGQASGSGQNGTPAVASAGSGGNGGAGGVWGANGHPGNVGNAGTEGIAGSAGSAGGLAGYAIINAGNVNISGSGAVQGR